MTSQRARIYALSVGIILLSLALVNPTRANGEQATRTYYVGYPPGGVDVAMASNGDKVTISGTGTFTPGEKDVSGGGTFVRTNAAGDIIAGTWRAEKLISWTSFGLAAPGSSSEGGIAVLKVHLTSSGGERGDAIVTHLAPSSEGERHGGGLEAVLTINCAIKAPPGLGDEGITLKVNGDGSIIFNDYDSEHGNTLFVVTAED